MKTMIKERLLFGLKYLTGVVLLIWILARIDRSEMIASLTGISWKVLSAVFVITLMNILAQFARWKFLVENNSSSFRAQDILPSFFAGFAFRLMIPGGHAEITKIFLLPGRKNGKVFAFGIEKFFQTLLKVILVLIALPLVFPKLKWSVWGLLGLVILGYFLLPGLMKKPFITRFQEREVSYPRIFLRTLLFSVAVFACLTLQYYILLNEIHEIDLIPTTLVVIFIWSSGLIPVSVSGLGVRENLAVFFLAQYGIPGYAAVGISLLLFLLNSILPALIGVFFIISGRQHLKDAGGVFREMKQRITNRNRPQPVSPVPDTPAELK